VLKHFLIEINNVINGNDEKIIRESREELKNYKVNPKDIIGLFSGLQQPLNRNREQRVTLGSKIWNELPDEDKFGGDADLGKVAFEGIERSVSIPHENFHLRYFGEKRPSEQAVYDLQASSSQQRDDDMMDLRREVPIKQITYQKPDNKSNSLDKTPIVIVALIGSIILFGGIVYKVKKNKIKK